MSVNSLLHAQKVSASFGVDADPWHDTMIVPGSSFGGSNPPVQGSLDWFPKPSTYFRTGDSGFFVIDTTGAYQIKQDHIGGTYYPFNRGMSRNPYFQFDTFKFIWAAYLRDDVGTDNSIFTGGDKNADNPETQWGITSGSIPDKNDLVEGAVFVMRSGLKTTSHLYLYGMSTVLANNGDRNLDYEMFRTEATISGANFINTGDDDGHTAWRFDKTTGDLKKYGDILVSVEGSGTTVNLISLRIWMKKSTYDSMIAGTHPLPTGGFTLSGSFEVSTSGLYGYAEIDYAASTSVEYFFGRTTSSLSANTPAPPWGGFGKSGGSNGYRPNDYFTGQFLEFGIDLTYMGIDPYQFQTVDTGDWCNPSFGSIMVKSRSSSSFPSTLKDFIGPASFVLPDISVTIAPIEGMNCITNDACTFVTDDSGYNTNNWYEWVNVNDLTTVLDTGKYFCTSTPGTYKVYSLRAEGCRRVDSTSSFIVAQDIRQPVAYAKVYDTLIDGAVYTVFMYGDSSQVFTNIEMAIDSNIFGPSQGLKYYWVGVDPWNNTFVDSVPNPGTGDTGWYRLIVTEPRNGCKDTALVEVVWLSVVWGDMSCRLNPENKVDVSFSTLSEEGIKSFEVQRFNTNKFESIGILPATGNSNTPVLYSFTDNSPLPGRNFYRIKMNSQNGSVEYSDYCETTVRGKVLNNDIQVSVFPNPSESELTVSISGIPANGSALNITDGLGQIVFSGILENNTSLLNISELPPGIYLLQVNGDGFTETRKVVKK